MTTNTRNRPIRRRRCAGVGSGGGAGVNRAPPRSSTEAVAGMVVVGPGARIASMTASSCRCTAAGLVGW
ncbi:MAG: hypothetical protein BWY76_03478 [bacterium ADurb.Bin429]|nr:MAG: hypothetical protein BWY76_03478 [bacterium ADurb.Bin429]